MYYVVLRCITNELQLIYHVDHVLNGTEILDHAYDTGIMSLFLTVTQESPVHVQ